jgi:uncharacterized MnhB-related membrane protein
MTMLAWLFDAVLAATLVAVAFRVLAAADLVTAIALFVAFGLLMTIVWVRLAAPDVALAEAGIGTGITGALLFAALARLRRAGTAAADRESRLDDEA